LVLVIAAIATAAGVSCSHDWSRFEASGGAGAGGSDTTSGGAQGGNGNGGSAGSLPNGVCGDGILDQGEECDDGNTNDNDGCTACKVDCDTAQGAVKDEKSHHCYWLLRLDHSFDIARQYCQGTARGNVDSAALSTQAELDFIKMQHVLTEAVWIGGRWTGTAWEWTNSEPWIYGDDQAGAKPPWSGAAGDNHSSLDCVTAQVDGKIAATNCQDFHFVLCERSPSIAKN
jgi:cysteine-rich repeat protein